MQKKGRLDRLQHTVKIFEDFLEDKNLKEEFENWVVEKYQEKTAGQMKGLVVPLNKVQGGES